MDELQLPMDTMPGFSNGNDKATHHLDAAHFRNTIGDAETKLDGAEPLFVFANHDAERDWDRFGDGIHDLAIAKIIAAMLLTTRDTALLYYGEEIGMRTHTPTRIEDVRDPIGRERWPNDKGRDGERTPMQWMPGPQAGFSSDPHTWLPVGDDYRMVNVRSEEEDPGSLLNWYEQLTRLREKNPAFAPDAKIEVLRNTAPDVLAYLRTGAGGRRALVLMNMGAVQQTFALDTTAMPGRLLTLASSDGSAARTADGQLLDSLPGGRHGGTVAVPPFDVLVLAADTNADVRTAAGKPN